MSINNNVVPNKLPSHELWENVFQEKVFEGHEPLKEKIIKTSEKILKFDHGVEILNLAIRSFSKKIQKGTITPPQILKEIKVYKYRLLELPAELLKTPAEIEEEFTSLNKEDRNHFKTLVTCGDFGRVKELSELCKVAFSQPRLVRQNSSYPPYDKSRVIFNDAEGNPCYYNASMGSFTDLNVNTRKMILAEAPKELQEGAKVRDDFWKMIVQNYVGVIVTVADPTEYDPYWPANGASLKLGDFIVETKDETVLATSAKIDGQKLVRRTLLVKDTNIVWECTQLHIEKWKDMSACDPLMLKNLIEGIYSSVDDLPREKAVLVHCVAGIGRTGVVATALQVSGALIDQKYEQIDNSQLEVRIKDRLLEIRKEVRMGLVIKSEQYSNVYNVVKRLFPIIAKLTFDESSSSKMHKSNPKAEK